MTFRWLHISDLHFKAGQSYDRDVVTKALINSLPRLISRVGKVDVIVMSGDVGFSGLEAEYANANAFFDSLLSAAGLTREALLVVPGNHDVDRKKGKGLSRTLDDQNSSDTYFDPSEPLPHIAQRQAAFGDWYNTYFAGIHSFPNNSTAMKARAFNNGSEAVEFTQFNTAIFCLNDEDSGKLWMGRRTLQPASSTANEKVDELKVAIMHHPLSWLNITESGSIKSSLRKKYECILCGHLHSTDIEEVAGLSGQSLHLQAGATYQTRDWPNRAMFASYEAGRLTVNPIRYEDTPEEVWTLDTSVFPDAEDYTRTYTVRDIGAPPSDLGRSANGTAQQTDVAGGRLLSTAAGLMHTDVSPTAEEHDVIDDLFVTPSGTALYAEPRIMRMPQDPNSFDTESQPSIPVSDIVNSDASIVIHVALEYGGTTLCKRLASDLNATKRFKVYREDSRELPNYRRKLEQHFPANVGDSGLPSVLILDNFEVDQHLKLLKELEATEWFDRIIVVCMNRSLSSSSILKGDLRNDYDSYYLWSIGRSDVRRMAETLFQSIDSGFITAVVDKVYSDLLGLCIPLTPLNTIMYLRILFKEGEFHPLNRVDIVGRYLQEVLRRPSDAYLDNFNSKNKMDVVSSLARSLFLSREHFLSEGQWYKFASEYKSHTLTDFDEKNLLDDLISSRILVRSGIEIYFKYSFYFSYLLGRYLAARPSELASFMEEKHYLEIGGVIDAVTGISSHNTDVVERLSEVLDQNLKQFNEKYVSAGFDPLANAIWPEGGEAERALWKSIDEKVDKEARSSSELDEIRTSLIAESRTADQVVRYTNMLEFERIMFYVARLLSDALKNSGDISGIQKLRALSLILRVEQVAFQIGSIFAPVLASQRVVMWGGAVFIDFNKVVEEHDRDSPQAVMAVVDALKYGVAHQIADEIGTQKLGAVFRAAERGEAETGYIGFIIFHCVLKARGDGWEASLASLINKVERRSFYLHSMLTTLLAFLENEVLLQKDREKIKRLIAMIQAKRQFNKQEPTSKSVTRMLHYMEKEDRFPKSAAE